MFEFNDSDKAEELAERAEALMEEVVIPKERELEGGTTVSKGTISELQAAAKEYGVYAPQIDEEYGGMGYDFNDCLPTFEQAGRSLLGAPAMRVDAPDEGNMHLLELHGSDLQKEEYLRPLVEGEIHSGFSMTEPMQGAGSDPKMIQTTAEKDTAEQSSASPVSAEATQDGDEWVINGHKWWTSNGIRADVLFVLARTDPDAHPYEACTVFVVPVEADGVEIVRNVPHLGSELTGTGHAEIKYHDVRVSEENVLGEVGEGFTHVQERLGPARLTHCMRFSGMAERALTVTRSYLEEREAFGSKIAEKQSARFDIARREAEVNAARSMVRHTADKIAAGEEARIGVSMSKVYTAQAAQDAIDTALQYLGGNGISKDLPISDFYESVRPFRIIDGADEVHLRTIAREAFEENTDPTELDPITRFGE